MHVFLAVMLLKLYTFSMFHHGVRQVYSESEEILLQYLNDALTLRLRIGCDDLKVNVHCPFLVVLVRQVYSRSLLLFIE